MVMVNRNVVYLKYQLTVWLLTSLGLSSDGLSTLMVTAIRRLGQTHMRAAEIYPDHGKSFSDVFVRSQKGGKGYLKVTYSSFIQPIGTRTPVLFDLSSCFYQCCWGNDKGRNVAALPILLQHLAFTLILQEKDVCTNPERASMAAVVLHMNLVNPMDFFVTHHNCHCVHV
jgi:hypothetical protein